MTENMCNTGDMQTIENNVVQIVVTLLEHGTPPHPLPELGPYTKICRMLLTHMPTAQDRAMREQMVTLVRCEPGHEAFDTLLRRAFKEPEKQPPELDMMSQEIEVPPLDYSILAPELASGACPWLDDAYLPFSRTWSPRAPEIHHIGCALWTLSTIAMRRLAVKEGRTLQYTPLYIQLVAPSSVWGKTTTARIAVDLLAQLDLGWILSPGMITPEKLLKNMAAITLPENYAALDEAQQELVRIKLAHSGQRGWYYSESGPLLKEMASGKGRNALFKSILLRMDDCERMACYDTVGRDLEEIQLPYLTLLGTMTPNYIKPSSYEDGFYARFAFCCVPLHQKKTQHDLDNEHFPASEGQFPVEILRPLQDFHHRLKLSLCDIETIPDEKGRVNSYKLIRPPIETYPLTTLSLHPDAQQALNNYGNALTLRAQDDELAPLRSYYSRLRDKTLRIATLFAALQQCTSIEIRHIARAQQIAEQFRHSIHQLNTHLNQSNSPSQQQEEKIMRILAQRGPSTVRDISRYIHCDTDAVRKKLDGLSRDGDILAISQGKKTVYCLVHE